MSASHTKSTPGPWVAEYGEAVSVLDAERGRVCTINWLRGPHGSFGRRTDAEGEANARLISAAPDLLEAARKILDHLNDRMASAGKAGAPVPVFVGIADLHAAIAKAEGLADHLMEAEMADDRKRGEEWARQHINALIEVGVLPTEDFKPCPGCDGHECDWIKGICAYPGASKSSEERGA
jgi:hypothetical protein